MLTRSHHVANDIIRRSHAQRRLRRAAGQRLFCSTNGCTTYLVPDESGRRAVCPVCGLVRRIRPSRGASSGAPAH